MNRPITLSDVREWVRLYTEEKETCSSIGRKYHINRDVVRKYLHMWGVKVIKKNARHGLVYDQMICLYDKDDFLRYCFENIYQMIEELKLDYYRAHRTISHVRAGRTKSIDLNGKRYKVVLIDNEEEV